MSFPDWVPVGARKYISFGQYDYNGSDSAYQSECTSCLIRLASDPRMEEVYNKLRDILNDDDWPKFLHAAWMVNVDYGYFRDRMESAKELAPKIAKASRELAKLLEKARKVGGFSEEFHSIECLLDIAESGNPEWRANRSIITGLYAHAAPTLPERNSLGNEGKIDPEEIARQTLRAAWQNAPTLPEILTTLAGAADDFFSVANGAVAVAIGRKRNPAVEYCRALGIVLRDEYQFNLTNPFFAAIAGTANVVLNDRDRIMCAEDVRSALSKTLSSKF